MCRRLDALGTINCERAVDALLRTIYGAGRAPMRAARSVVHVAAVWEREDCSLVRASVQQCPRLHLFLHDCSDFTRCLHPSARLRWADQVVINVGAGAAPRSAHDAFVLSAARARAGAILTTGANVRAEPLLRHEPFGAGAQGLKKWRRERITRGSDIPPHTVVLTRDASLDLGHPLFSDGGKAAAAYVLTDRAAALSLCRQRHEIATQPNYEAVPHILEMRGRATSSPVSPITFARSLPFVGDVLLECGVSTARPLYDMGTVDELLLSVYRGSLDKSAQGKPFLSWEEIQQYFGVEELSKGVAQQYCVHAQSPLQSVQSLQDQSGGTLAGHWSFLRFRSRQRRVEPVVGDTLLR